MVFMGRYGQSIGTCWHPDGPSQRRKRDRKRRRRSGDGGERGPGRREGEGSGVGGEKGAGRKEGSGEGGDDVKLGKVEDEKEKGEWG